jgi:hypothetical protein
MLFSNTYSHVVANFLNSGNILNVTLWEDFAKQFAKYNKERTDWGPTIVLMHNAKIKEATG